MSSLPDDLTDNQWVKGIMNIDLQLKDILKKYGLEEISVKKAINLIRIFAKLFLQKKMEAKILKKFFKKVIYWAVVLLGRLKLK